MIEGCRKLKCEQLPELSFGTWLERQAAEGRGGHAVIRLVAIPRIWNDPTLILPLKGGNNLLWDGEPVAGRVLGLPYNQWFCLYHSMVFRIPSSSPTCCSNPKSFLALDASHVQ